ncbi:hypothetical protein RRF57_005108 [Xylaria bambusicola]|uniref:Uncharacterized protein n=1 Tax=Xylaria bambusicola TaxID=326684 RepID=A0AAN7UKN6_9PEZI
MPSIASEYTVRDGSVDARLSIICGISLRPYSFPHASFSLNKGIPALFSLAVCLGLLDVTLGEGGVRGVGTSSARGSETVRRLPGVATPEDDPEVLSKYSLVVIALAFANEALMLRPLLVASGISLK